MKERGPDDRQQDPDGAARRRRPGGGSPGPRLHGHELGYGPSDGDASRATLERALELGVTLYDTADAYGAGENERFLSPFFKAHRDEVVIATKFALSIPPDEPTKRIIRNDPPYIRRAVEASLGRLGVDVIDLYYMHRRDVNVPIEETVAVMADLVREGKVKHPRAERGDGRRAAGRTDGASDRRRAVGVVAVQPGHRGGRGAGRPRTRRGPRPVLAARPGLPHRRLRRRRPGPHGRRLPPAAAPLHRRQRGGQRGPARPGPHGRRGPRRHPSGRSPWPGPSSGRGCTACR